MRTPPTLIAALIFALPMLTFAAAFGFPRQPLWVSDSSVQAGEAITMYVAVYNASDADMKGTVSFLADGKVFDTKDVQLAAGASSLVTDSWDAIKGSHSLSATFASGTLKDTSEKVTVTVSAAPPLAAAPTPLSAPMPTVNKTVTQATDMMKNIVTPTSPVTKVANAILGQTENLRHAGGNLLRPYAISNSSATTSTVKGFTKPAASKDTSMLHNITQAAAAGALYAFDIKWLFYALLVIILFFVLRKIKRWATGPRF